MPNLSSTPTWGVMVLAVALALAAPLFASALQAALQKRLRKRTLEVIAHARRVGQDSDAAAESTESERPVIAGAPSASRISTHEGRR